MTKEEYFSDKHCLFCGQKADNASVIGFRDIKRETTPYICRSSLKTIFGCKRHPVCGVFFNGDGTAEVGVPVT